MYKSLCAEQVDFPVAHNNSLGKLSSRMRHNNEKDEHLTSLCAIPFDKNEKGTCNKGIRKHLHAG